MKIKILLLLFVLAFTLTGCVITSDKPTDQPTTEKPVETSQEETTTPSEDETVEPGNGNDDDIVTIMPVDNYHTVKGIYIGRADTSAIELKTIDDYMTLTLFMDDEERMLGEVFSETAVFVEYETNNIGQNVVINIELAPEPGTPEILGNETSGVFVEHIDEDKCHIKVNDQTRLYWIALELRTQGFDELSEKNLIDFYYYTDEYGRDVIIGFEII